MLLKEMPCMIARFGSGELYTALNYINKDDYKELSEIIKYLLGRKAFLYWEAGIINGLIMGAVFFRKILKK